MTPSDQTARRVALGSIGVGIIVLLLKSVAWRLTGSAGLCADALETLTNIVTALVAYAAFCYALRPPDASHPYGHGKAEFFAAVLEGVMVVLASWMILMEAWRVWNAPHDLRLPWRGLALNGTATILNAVWARIVLRMGKKVRSVALSADGRHLMADVAASSGIVLGVGLAVLTGWIALDPIMAALTAAYVLGSGIVMISGSVDGLMDAAPRAEIVERIRTLVAEHAAGALEAHDLRTRHAGRATYLEFHLVVPGAMRVAEAHMICDRIESALRTAFHDLVVTIHVEPEGKAKHHGVIVL